MNGLYDIPQWMSQGILWHILLTHQTEILMQFSHPYVVYITPYTFSLNTRETLRNAPICTNRKFRQISHSFLAASRNARRIVSDLIGPQP